MSRLWVGKWLDLAKDGAAVELSVLPQAVYSDGRDRDAAVASAVADLGTGNLPRRIILQGHLRHEAR